MIKRYDWDDGLLADDDGDLCRWDEVEKLQAERDAYKASYERLRITLLKYAYHDDGCAYYADPPSKCNCGCEQLIALCGEAVKP